MLGIAPSSLYQTIKVSLILKHLSRSIPLMMPHKVITGFIKHLERAQYFTQMRFGFQVDFLNRFVTVERKDGYVGYCRAARAEDGNGRDDPDGSFRSWYER
jgi:hypothetical protein